MQSVKKKSICKLPTNLADFFPMTECFNIKQRKLETSNIIDRQENSLYAFLPLSQVEVCLFSLIHVGFSCPKLSPILSFQFDREDIRE